MTQAILPSAAAAMAVALATPFLTKEASGAIRAPLHLAGAIATASHG